MNIKVDINERENRKRREKPKSWCFKSNKTELSRMDNQGTAKIEEQEDSKIDHFLLYDSNS